MRAFIEAPDQADPPSTLKNENLDEALQVVRVNSSRSKTSLEEKFLSYDSKKTGKMDSLLFQNVLLREGLVPPNNNVVVNWLLAKYREPYGENVDYVKMIRDVNDISKRAGPVYEVVAERIYAFALYDKADPTLNNLFKKYSRNGIMEYLKFKSLCEISNWPNVTDENLESIFNRVNTEKDSFLSFYEFLGLFKDQIRLKEITKKFFPDRDIVNFLKTQASKSSESMVEMFRDCKTVDDLTIRIKRIATDNNANDLKVETFTNKFFYDKRLDTYGLDMVDRTLKNDFGVLKTEQPNNIGKFDDTKVIVPGDNNNTTFHDLRDIKNMIQQIDSFMKQDKLPFPKMFIKFDKKNKGEVTEEQFE